MKICDFTMPELRRFLAECNFTNDEFLIFKLLSEGCTNENVAELTNYSVSTIKRFRKKIENKISKVKWT